MGMGFDFRCKKCGKRYSIFLGVGMLYPSVVSELMQEIREGKHGKKRQQLCLEHPNAMVDAENVIYICDTCGCWRELQNLTLYAPNDENYTSDDDGYLLDDFLERYHVLLEHKIRCGKCRKPMREATEEEIRHLSCPKCGTENESTGEICWD